MHIAPLNFGLGRELEGFCRLLQHTPHVRGDESEAEIMVDDHDDDDDHDV
jgi:hypothetical protein